MSEQIPASAARILAAVAYEVGWRNACDDHLTQQRDPQHPIGESKLQTTEALLAVIDPHNLLGLR